MEIGAAFFPLSPTRLGGNVFGNNRGRNGTRPLFSDANELHASDLRKRRSLAFLINPPTCDDARFCAHGRYLAVLTTGEALTCGNADR